MINAWLLDDPSFRISAKALKVLGVLYWHFDPNNYEKSLEAIKTRRGYTYEDTCCISNEMENLEEKLKIFYEEHIHKDEEIRFFLEGSGYFDVRGVNDHWIRIHGGPGDLIVLPAGIYHRYSLDEHRYSKVLRLFVGEPVWTPHNRTKETDGFIERKRYLTYVDYKAGEEDEDNDDEEDASDEDFDEASASDDSESSFSSSSSSGSPDYSDSASSGSGGSSKSESESEDDEDSDGEPRPKKRKRANEGSSKNKKKAKKSEK